MKKLLIIAASILLGSATLVGATSVFSPFQGGTGTSTPSGILTGQNSGTLPLKTVVIGTGLSFDGTTLSSTALTAAITDLGAGGATTTGPKVTLSTTTSTTNGLTSALSIIVSGTQINFTPSQSGTLAIGGGGTNATTFGTSNGITAFDGTRLVNYTGYTLTSSLLSATNASTTFTQADKSFLLGYNSGVGGLMIQGSGGGWNQTLWNDNSNLVHIVNQNAAALVFGTNGNEQARITSGGNFGIGTTSPYAPLSVVGQTVAAYFTGTTSSINTFPNASTTAFSINNKTAIADRFLTFSYSTTTAWTGSSTLLELGPAPFGMTWNSVSCHTTAGTLNVQYQYGTGPTLTLPMFNASTTNGTVTFTSNNTPAKGNSMAVTVGTPASTPTGISCTVNATITSI